MPTRPSLHHIWITPLLLAQLVAQDPGAQPSDAQRGVRDTVWHTNFDAARKLAAAQHAPLLVMFRCER